MERIKSYIIAGLVLFLIVFFSVRSCSRQEEKQETKTFDSTSIYKSKLATIQAQGEEKLKQIKQDTVKTWIALQALKHENKELRKRIVPVRKELQPVIDSMAIVREFVGLTDSLDLVQEAEIDTLSAEKVRIWRSFNSLLANKDEQIKVSTDLNNHFDQLNKDLSKQVKKQRNLKTFYKIAFGIAVGGLVFQSFN